MTQGIKESLIIVGTQGQIEAITFLNRDVGKMSKGLEEVFIQSSPLKSSKGKSFKGESLEMGHN